MKKWMVLIAACMLCIVGFASGEGNNTLYEIDETGLSLCIPAGWTQSEGTPALMEFTAEDEDGRLLSLAEKP